MIYLIISSRSCNSAKFDTERPIERVSKSKNQSIYYYAIITYTLIILSRFYENLNLLGAKVLVKNTSTKTKIPIKKISLLDWFSTLHVIQLVRLSIAARL